MGKSATVALRFRLNPTGRPAHAFRAKSFPFCEVRRIGARVEIGWPVSAGCAEVPEHTEGELPVLSRRFISHNLHSKRQAPQSALSSYLHCALNAENLASFEVRRIRPAVVIRWPETAALVEMPNFAERDLPVLSRNFISHSHHSTWNWLKKKSPLEFPDGARWRLSTAGNPVVASCPLRRRLGAPN